MPILITITGPIAAGKNTVADLVDAPLSTTWQRVTADAHRRMSRQRDFHESAHARYRSLKDRIPADLVFDSEKLPAAAIAERILSAAGLTP